MSNDINNDGKIDEREIKVIERKMRVARRFAIISFGANLTLVGVLVWAVLSGFMTPAMATSLGTLLPMYWVGSWGIIAAWMGVDTWMNKK